MHVKYDPNNVVNRNFGSYSENDVLVVINQNFLNGTLTSTLNTDLRADNQAEYLIQCLHALEWSFNQFLIKEDVMAKFLSGAVVEMEQQIKEALDMLNDVADKEQVREKLNLESTPFKFTKRRQINIHDLPKDDERRLAFQALFLFVLRPKLPIKYETMQSFLAVYPELRERGPAEQEKLRLTANWMDLAFYVLPSKNNKTFILNLIPRVVEGRGVKYITGSGQTKPTTDRVTLFRGEGQCEKVVRPPRKKREENSCSSGSVDGSVSHHYRPDGTNSLFGAGDLSSLGGGNRFVALPPYLQQHHNQFLLQQQQQQQHQMNKEHQLGGDDGSSGSSLLHHSNFSAGSHVLESTSGVLGGHNHATPHMSLPSLADMQQQASLSTDMLPVHSYGGTNLLLSGMSNSGSTLDVPAFAYNFTPMTSSSSSSSGGGLFGVNTDIIRIPEPFQLVSDSRRDLIASTKNGNSSSSGSCKRPRADPETVDPEEVDSISGRPAKRDGLALLSVIAGLELEK